MYVRDYVAPGMLVRCCKSHEDVYPGDIGRVLSVEYEVNEGLHDLNLQVKCLKKSLSWMI